MMRKINPSKIKSVKTKKSTGIYAQQISLPSTKQVQRSKHMQSHGMLSEFTEVAHRDSNKESMIQSMDKMSAEESTLKDVIIERGIRYLHVPKQNTVRRFNTLSNKTVSQVTGGLTFIDNKQLAGASANHSRVSSQFTKDKQ